MFEAGKRYRVKDNQYARSIGITIPNTVLLVTKVTSRTVWFKTIPGDGYHITYLYLKEFSQLAEENSVWAGSKLNFNFVY